MPAKEVSRKNWQVYRSKFIEPIRIKAGQEFIANNKALLDKVQTEYGVDSSIIAAIIGVESIYGRYIGNFNVLNTLYTLAFYYPDTPNKTAREIMFQKQLAEYIIWAQDQGSFNHYGSYAGAMGMPQFMPESIRQYAVDYDKDGQIDLINSIPDVVASVANFLKKHGWRQGERIVLDVEPSYENIALLKANATGKPQANLTFSDLPSLKFDYKAIGLAINTPLLVIDLPSGNDVEYKLGLYNFYVLTRYNQSFFYALSVYELANAIKF
jgi:membrane-bound lytic murein transglycosylase B